MVCKLTANSMAKCKALRMRFKRLRVLLFHKTVDFTFYIG
jgi:hypothetical protein